VCFLLSKWLVIDPDCITQQGRCQLHVSRKKGRLEGNFQAVADDQTERDRVPNLWQRREEMGAAVYQIVHAGYLEGLQEETDLRQFILQFISDFPASGRRRPSAGVVPIRPDKVLMMCLGNDETRTPWVGA
jgi:hypothetical protein